MGIIAYASLYKFDSRNLLAAAPQELLLKQQPSRSRATLRLIEFGIACVKIAALVKQGGDQADSSPNKSES